jgi:hypothetical protein
MGRLFAVWIFVSLLVASTSGTFAQRAAVGNGAEIRATGFFATEFPTADGGTPPLNWTRPRSDSPKIAQLNIFARPSVSTFHGPCDDPPCPTGLEGQTVSMQNGVRDDDVRLQAFQTNLGSFFGRLDQFGGSFSLISHVVLDRSKCLPFIAQDPPQTCPGRLIPFEGRTVVIAGTGMGDLEGICGGGTFHSEKNPDGTNGRTAYDYTFRFGAACNANP